MPDHPDNESMVRPTKTENVGIVNYTEFGTLKKVEDVGRYVRIYNETGWYAEMKKVYMNWAKVMLKAQDLVDKPVVIETGASASAVDYFRDLCEDTKDGFLNQGILSIPEDAGPHAKALLVSERVSSQHKSYALRKALEWATEEKKRREEAAAAMAIEDRENVDAATAALDLEWDKFVQYPDRQLLVTGAAWTGGTKPKNIDKKMALRLGFSTMKTKRINVKVLGRFHRNYIQVMLPDHDKMICLFGIMQSDHQKTKGEWSIVTVDPQIPGWFDAELQHYPDCKTFNEPISWFIERNQEMLSLLTKAA
jgi:hypothetical protein